MPSIYRYRRVRAGTVLLVGAAVLVLPQLAAGHAYLLRTDPPANAVLGAAPPKLTVQFDSHVVRAHSTLLLRDASGAAVGPPGGVAPDDARRLELVPPRLRPGQYVLVWRVLSPIDGHIIRGAVAFRIGQGAAGGREDVPAEAALLPPRGGWEDARGTVGVALRWLVLGGLALALGGFVLTWAAAPAFGRTDVKLRAVAAAWRTRLAWTAAMAAGTVAVATALEIVLEASALAERPPWDLVQQPRPLVDVLLTLRGAMLLGTIILATLSATSARRWGRRESTTLEPPGLASIGATCLVSFLAATGHAGSVPWGAGLPAVINGVHLAAACIWIGGLAHLAFGLPALARAMPDDEGAELRLAVLRRFSPLALGSAIALGVSGILNAIAQVASPELLWESPYGKILLTKVFLAGVLVALGAANFFAVRHAAEVVLVAKEAWAWARRRLARTGTVVRAEVVVGAMVFLAAAILAVLPPPRVAVPAAARVTPVAAASVAPPELPLIIPAGLTLGQRVGADVVTLTLTPPGAAGEDGQALVSFAETSGTPRGDVLRVTLHATLLEPQTAADPVLAQPAGEGRFWAPWPLAIDGQWRVEVLYRRRGAEYARAAFSVQQAGGTVVAQGPEDLKFELNPIPNPLRVGPGQLWIRVQTPDGKPATVQKLVALIVPPAGAGPVRLLEAVPKANGLFVARTDFPVRGWWTLSLDAIREEARTTMTYRAEVLAPPERDAAGNEVYRVSGRVVEVALPPSRHHATRPVVVLDHEPVRGLMSAHTMPFIAASAEVIKDFRPGERVRVALTNTLEALLVTELVRLEP